MTDNDNRPWINAYPEGIPAEIDPEGYSSLKALIERSFERFASEPAFSNAGTRLSYTEMDELSRHFAAFLQARGLKRGDRIAIMMPNLLQYPVAVFAALRAGLAVVNVNPLYTPRELEHQLSDSGARAILVLENFAHTVEQVVQDTDVETVIVTEIGDQHPPFKRVLVNLVVRHVKKLVPRWNIAGTVRYKAALAEGRRAPFQDVEVTGDDIAFLQYTGGTTGVAKGAMLTHRNMVANILQISAWSKPYLQGPGDIGAAPLPLYHIFALTVNLFLFFELGGHDMLVTNPRDLPSFIKDLAREPVTLVTGVNTLFAALLESPDFRELDFSKLKICLGGGMAVQSDIAARWKDLTGQNLCQGYGLTETSPVVTANPLDGREFNGSVGLPIPSTDVEIRDDDGNTLSIGEIGEICVRGPQVMRGYWQRPEATAEILSDDGWLQTGDIGRMDEQGFVYIEDRKKDMIIVSGFNVYPNEVEDVATAHPGVLEAAAIGIPHEQSGEAVRLFVVRRDPELPADDVIAHCREQLTRYTVPREVVFREDMPKTNVGKILRRELRD
ncbi:MAG: AMP-binding protein [Proteobacteria bacterium]|nr:AMP-binding protein [Pseudomonadota bacterium]